MPYEIQTISTYYTRIRESAQSAVSIDDCPFEFQQDIDRWQDEFKRAQAHNEQKATA